MTSDVNTPRTVTINYGGEDAGFTNMVGTYQLDANNCVINPEIILANSDDDSLIGQQLGPAITSPPTFIFLISNGYNTFKNGSDRPQEGDTVTINHCFSDVTDNTSNPTLRINGITSNNANVYFESTELNGDEYPHIQIIPNNVWTLYNHFVNGTGSYSGQGTKTYNQFIAECNNVNYDNDNTNDIPNTNYIEGINDCIHDINDQYHYAMEDLNGGGDEDFNDIFLDTTRVVIPNQLNTYTVQNDGSINLTCNNNSAPTLSLSCPNPINENTSTTFAYIATDSDGTIATTVGSALNGTLTNNGNDSFTYTPDSDYFGEDTISITTTDNEGASNTQTCTITINEINLPPTINGIPNPTIETGSNYIFIPSANDPEGETLTFSISNKPSWATFNTSTGQLSGQPQNTNVGVYSNIIISVSDGVNSVSLNSFNINVTENTNNTAPICNTIPTQTATEKQAFNSLNLNTYCSDSDGDTLSYTVSATALGYTRTTDGLISINPVPDNTQSFSPVTITVIANDGTDTTTTSFILNIIANAECNVFPLEDFSNGKEGWSGNSDNYVTSTESRLRIKDGSPISKTYNFGTGCKNTTINISFNMYYHDTWEGSGQYEDFFRVELNDSGSYIINDNGKSGSNYYSGSPDIYSINGTTNTDGRLKIEMSINVTNATEERAYIDYVQVTAQ